MSCTSTLNFMTRDSCVYLSFVGLGLDWLGWGRSALLGATLITDHGDERLVK